MASWSRSPTTTYSKNLKHCMDLVDQRDHDMYMIALLLPPQHRFGYLALQAFNIETAAVQDQARDPNVARLRLKWWQDEIDRIFRKEEVNHPISQVLARVVQESKLSKSWFNRLISAREKSVDSNYISGIEKLDEYGEATASALLYLVLQMAGIASVHVDHAASHLGKAYATVLRLRAIPNLARLRKIEIPSQLIDKHKIDLNSVVSGEGGQALSDAAYEMACHARAHLIKAREMRDAVPKGAHNYFLSSVPTDLYLTNLQKANFNVMDPSLRARTPDIRVQFSLLTHKYWWRHF